MSKTERSWCTKCRHKWLKLFVKGWAEDTVDAFYIQDKAWLMCHYRTMIADVEARVAPFKKKTNGDKICNAVHSDCKPGCICKELTNEPASSLHTTQEE